METPDSKKVIYEFGEFVLDPEEKTLLVDDTPIRLSAKEFHTLLLLVENNGRALSKEEMIEAIWEDTAVEEGNLAKQISRLRKVFSSSGGEYIETLPKHGYRFNADLRRSVVDPLEPLILEKRTVKRVTVAFENEPEKRALPAGPSKRSSLWKAAIALAALILLIGVIIWWQRTRTAANAIHSVAVLPLQPLGGDEDNRALGLGLTDELITKLGSLRRVVVPPLNAVAANSAGDPREVGRKLKTDAVLVGTIQEADGRLRVNAQLIRTNNGEQIWSDRFEQPSSGIFALQDALSESITRALAFELTKSDSKVLSRRDTENASAYEKYLRGKFYESQNTPQGLNRAIELYQQAIALDPKFAKAYAGIADANIILYNFGLRPANEAIPLARQAANRALELNPELSDAHNSIALVELLADRNWAAAEASLQKAIDLNPNNADAYLRYGYFLINVGRFDDALEKLEKARELDPVSPIIKSDIGLAYMCARRYPQAIEQLERTSAEYPQFSLPQWFLGTSYEANGDAERAFQANLRALRTDGADELAEKLRGIKESNGIDAANNTWFDEMVKSRQSQPGKTAAIDIAMRAATLKDGEQTLYWLQKALEEDEPTLFGINYLSKFDFVRDDPRFQAIAKKVTF